MLPLRLTTFALSFVLMLYGFWGMFGRAIAMFEAPEEDMSYAWYVPVFSLYVLWSERARLRAALAASRPSWTGLALSVPFMLLALLGTRGLQLRFEQLGFMGLCVTLPWTFFGRRVASCFVFPALYLVFTIPVTSFLSPVTVRLRMLASSVALAVLSGCGIDAVQQGTAVISQGAHPFSIDVAEPCSGLRSLFALLALTAAYAWYNQPTWTRRAILFVCAVPLAVLGNVMRVLTICLVATCSSADFALGFYHDYSGFVIFGVALSLMVACGSLLDRICASSRASALPTPPELPKPPKLPKPSLLLPAFATLFFAAVFLFQATTPAGKVMSPPKVKLPPSPQGFTSETIYYCQNDVCSRAWKASQLDASPVSCPTCGGKLDLSSLGEHRILPADTAIVRRLYHGPMGRDYLVSMVIGGTSKSSIHRPELCLPSQGFLMTGARDISVAGYPFHVVKVTPPRGGAPSLLVYTFFNQAGFRTASHPRRIWEDTWDRSVRNRVDRWVMVSVFASNGESARGFDVDVSVDRTALEAFLNVLAEDLP